MTDTDDKKYLRRYTSLPAVIYLLRKRKITLLDPESWDDSNDSHYLLLYREKMGLKTVLALCFTQTTETYHHWRVFAHGSSGVRIRFKRAELLRAMRGQPGLRSETVIYKTLEEMRNEKAKINELPFLKRYPFEDEREFRMIYGSEKRKSKLDIPIPLSCIDKITLSPWIDSNVFAEIKEVLKSIDGCRELDVAHTSLINSKTWKEFGERAR